MLAWHLEAWLAAKSTARSALSMTGVRGRRSQAADENLRLVAAVIPASAMRRHLRHRRR